jgi:chemotaxis protein histidine kinase CheA
MEELREAFLSDSISKLDNLRNDLQSGEFSPASHREIFRALHTIKGTSQTFGFAASAILAHTLENLLAAEHDSIPAEKLKALLNEGIAVLIGSLSEKNFRIPDSFVEKFRPFQSPPEIISTSWKSVSTRQALPTNSKPFAKN